MGRAERSKREEFCRLIADALGGGVSPAMVAASLGKDGNPGPGCASTPKSTALAGSQALWLYVLIAASGQAAASDAQAALAQKAFWPQDGAPPPPSAPAFFDRAFRSRRIGGTRLPRCPIRVNNEA